MLANEIILAIVGILATLATGGVYAIRKWSDAREKLSVHEAQMTMKKLEHELELERRREDRQNTRLEQELETSKYIQTNTEVLRSLKEAIEKELGNGIRSAVRENAENTARLSAGVQEVLATVKNIQSQVSNQGS